MFAGGKDTYDMKRRYFIFDAEKCIGCYNCLHACKDEHVGNDFSPVTLPQKLHRQYWITTTEHVRGQAPMIDVTYLTEPCGHCENAPCLAAGNGAIVRRDDGIVLIDPEKAGEAGDLSDACPFGKISYNEEHGLSQKCTFCAHLLDEGWHQPRCAHACPLGALRMEYEEPGIMAERLVSGEFEQIGEPYSSCGSCLYVRNLYRLNTLFLGGKVTAISGGTETCFEGCTVTLEHSGSVIRSQTADAFGEYKFDRLLPGEYTVCISASGYTAHRMQVCPDKSIFTGTVTLSREL